MSHSQHHQEDNSVNVKVAVIFVAVIVVLALISIFN
jgi:hypothetical protein